MLEVQQALTITLSPTTKGYKIIFLSPLAGSTAGPYHHPITYNKREQEDYPLPFPTCWKYSRPLPSHYHPQQEGIRAVFSSLPNLLEVQQAHTITIAPTTRRYKRSIFLYPLARSIAGPYYHLTTHNKEYPLPFFLSPLAGSTADPYYHPTYPQQEGIGRVSSFFLHLLEVQQALTNTLSPTTKGYKSILFLSPLAGSTADPYYHPTYPQQEDIGGVSSFFLHLLEVQQALTNTLSPTTKGYKNILFLSPLAGSTADPYYHPTYPQQEGIGGVSSFFLHLLEVQQALTNTLSPTTKGYKSILFLSRLLEVQQALTITLSPTTVGYKRSILFLSPLAGSTACPFHRSTTHNKRVQEEYPLSFPSCWKYSRPLPSTYHPQQEGTRGVSSFFPHLLEVQQALTITLSPTTRGYKRSILILSPLTTREYRKSILFLSPLAGNTAGPYYHLITTTKGYKSILSLLAESTAGHYHHPITHNKRVQEEYPLPIPTCWKYSRPLLSPYHPQQEGTKGVSSSFPYLLEVQLAITITLSPTTRGYKRSILFLFLLAGSTAGPYHHPTTHNKRVQEEFPLPFPTCWKYIRALPSPNHPRQEGTRGVSSSFPHLLEIQEALTITLSSTTRGFLSLLTGSTAGHYHHPITHNKRVQEYPLFPHLLVAQEALTITLPPPTRGYKRSILFLSPLAGSIAGPSNKLITHNKIVQEEYPLPIHTTHNKRVQEEHSLPFPTCWKYSRPLPSLYHPQQEM